ncbi:DNA polymerase III subunit delta [Streptococcus sp. DD13]|uniref:DNA polymerase III subunit delta n=1 Tax=Streptococcus sp. DD13 TaxID=1777881 RepID=UPI0007979CCA|nr:DNA polymerase III subunit delta [Streptococcus sp. DD13]KXT78496.1 DNA polymerase III delta subunit [Streptococcus sp. DD13]
MLAIEEVQLLSLENLPALTVITGEDLGQYAQVKEKLLELLHYEASDLRFSYFDLSESVFEEVLNDLESLPFFEEEKIILVDQFLDVTTQKKNFLKEDELKKLEAYLEHPNETNRVIFFAPGKLDGKRRIVKLLKRDARVIEAASIKEAELASYFSKVVQNVGLQMEPSVFRAFLEKSNMDFSECHKNIQFLLAYKASGFVTLEDIQEALPKTLQDNVFELSQLLLQGKIDKARQLVSDLRLQGQEEVQLVAILLNQFRIMLQVKILSQRQGGESQIVASLSRILGRQVNPYQVRFALRDSRQYSISFFEQAVKELIQCDFEIKSGKMEKEYLFDLLLLRLLSFTS